MVSLSMGCGGSLHAPQIVSTAGHCVDNSGPDKTIVATAGTVDLLKPNATKVNSTHVHRGETGDWALINLAKPIKLGPIPLATSSALDNGTFTVMG